MDTELKQTAALVTELGWGGEDGIRGKPVTIYGAPSNYDLVVAISALSYDKGATHVCFVPFAPEITALHLRSHANNAVVRNEVLPFFADAWNSLVDVQGCTVRIESPEDPLALKDCPSEHVSERSAAEYAARQYFYDKGLFGKTLPWTIVPRATEGWGRLVCPDASDPRAALQEILNTILDVSSDGAVERWRERATRIERRAERLMELGLSELHFEGPDTDLRVGLSEHALFSGALKTTEFGVQHLANIPTFENFTTPDWRKTRGRVRMTRPVLIDGTLVEGLQIEFAESGEVSHFSATKGEHAFGALMKNSGANRLGEVALVGIDDSSIFTSGKLFSNTLLDENAACHIAFGRAYPGQLVHGTKMSREELEAIGCNFSERHNDMMISDERTQVIGIDRTGNRHEIIVNGKWAQAFQ